MPDRELIEIAWRDNRPDVFQLIYSSGPIDLAPGGQEDAAERARREGLIQVATDDHLARWVKAANWQTPVGAGNQSDFEYGKSDFEYEN